MSDRGGGGGRGRGRGFRGSRGRGGRGGAWRPWRGRWRGRGTKRGGGDSSLLMPPPEPRSQRPPLTPAVSSTSQRVVTDVPVGTRFQAWNQYLPFEPFSPGCPAEGKVHAASAFLARHPPADDEEGLEQDRRFFIDAPVLRADEELRADWKDVYDDLLERPELVQGVFGLALHQRLVDARARRMAADAADCGGFTPDEAKFPLVRARILDVVEASPVRELQTRDHGKLLCVRGTVARASAVRPLCMWLAFRCTLCLSIQSVHQPYGKLTEPKTCAAAPCKGRRFAPVRGHLRTVTHDWQTLRLQEVSSQESGRVPPTLEAEVTEDLCDTVTPGDVVTLTGVVRSVNLAEKDKFVFQLYLHALSVTSEKKKTSASVAGLEFTQDDYCVIRHIHDMGSHALKLLVHSLCPSIYGHDLVKAGLLLGLFGGTNKYQSDRTHIPVRGDPHILVVGDPGLGKSQILNSCAGVAPRSVFVTGNTTTSSGLTVTLSKDSGNDFSLEAGALVLADQGICCIDEFDKMSSQHQALLEAMEQQTISIAKSGVVCSLPARTAILAAANPVGGHYNQSKTVAENLKLSPALLSRFDLVFILVDKPNSELDGFLSEHIMRLHNAAAASSSSKNKVFGDRSVTSVFEEASGCEILNERLRKKPSEMIEPIPHNLMRKYIAYARQWVFPKLTKAACSVIQDFYLELRRRHHSADLAPISLRQLESLVRLTEARARIELREEASAEDARDVVQILRASMADTLTDGVSGKVDFNRSLNSGSGMSTRGAAKRFVAALQRKAELSQKSTFTVDEMRDVLTACGAKVTNFFDFLSSLNTQGYLIKKSTKVYQLMTVEF